MPRDLHPGDRLIAIQRFRRREAVPMHVALDEHDRDRARAEAWLDEQVEHRIPLTVHWVRRNGSFQAEAESGIRYEFDAAGVCRRYGIAGTVRIDWKATEVRDVA